MPKSVQVGALKISHTETGNGPPLILLHGGLATAAMSWGTATPLLAPHFRVLAPDSRGQGGTNNPDDHLGYDQMADDVVAFAKAVGADRPLVFGFSDGGQIGLEMALRHPGFARAYVFGGTISERTQSYLDSLAGWGFTGPGQVDFVALERNWGDFFTAIQQVHKGSGEPEYWRKLLPQIATLWYGVPTYSIDQLGTIGEPSLVIMGDRDHMAGEHQPMRLYKALPKGELAIIPNADHGAAETEIFWLVVLEFLRRHAG
jgi:pimeloyl-ACP methyl ester carboxylesterase